MPSPPQVIGAVTSPRGNAGRAAGCSVSSLIPPCDLAAERALLGAILYEGPAVLRQVAASLPDTAWFLERHRLIYRAALTLDAAGHPIDTVSLAASLRAQGVPDTPDLTLLWSELLAEAIVPAYALRYAAIIAEAAQRRDFLQLAARLMHGATNGSTASDLTAWTSAVLEQHATAQARQRPGEAPTELTALLAYTFPLQPAIIGRGLLPQGGLLVLGGGPKIGKSLLLDNLCLQRAYGRPWLDFPTDPGTTLVVQSEVRAEAVQSRFRSMLAHEEEPFPPGRLHVQTRRGILLDTPEGLAQISAWIVETGASLVRVDPLARHMQGDENSNTAMGAVVRAVDTLIERHGVSVILVHHPSKPSKDDPRKGGDRLRGGGSLFGAADTVMMLDRDGEDFLLTCELRHGTTPQPIRLTRTEDLWMVPTGPDPDLLAVATLVQSSSLPYRTLVAACVSDLGISDRTATRRIAAALTAGLVRKDADGAYKAAPGVHTAPQCQPVSGF